MDIWRENFGEFGADSDIIRYGHLDKWGLHCSGRNDLIVDGRLDEALMEGWSGLGDVVSFWGPFFPGVR